MASAVDTDVKDEPPLINASLCGAVVTDAPFNPSQVLKYQNLIATNIL